MLGDFGIHDSMMSGGGYGGLHFGTSMNEHRGFEDERSKTGGINNTLNARNSLGGTELVPE